MKRIGIFGGTFDPVHKGHLTVAEEFARSLDLETVYLIPAAVPPHRPDPPVAPPQDRLEMLTLAVAGNSVLKVSELELQREGVSYTLDTIRDLREDTGGGEFFLALVPISAPRSASAPINSTPGVLWALRSLRVRNSSF